MPRLANRLTALTVKQTLEKGWYADGHGLYLQISASGTKSWVFRYSRHGRNHWHGLGAVTSFNGLKEARLAAENCRRILHEGDDPIEVKAKVKRDQKLANAAAVNFATCAEQYITRHRHGWKNEKHSKQWESSLTSYAFPVIGKEPIQDIDTRQVLEILEPIWHTKTETANRVRQRIELIIDWATALEYREGANPARWRGHLEKLLPKPSKVNPVTHLAAMPYQEVPNFFVQLTRTRTTASVLLQATILTASRASEMRLATWDEFNLIEAIWEVPAKRMKNGRSHRIPLPDRLVGILSNFETDSEFIFENTKRNAPVTEAASRKLLKSLAPEVTLHGFRSSFRDWCAEQTEFSRELAEKALSHALSSQVEAAYQRGDLLERRRKLMAAWCDYCFSYVRGLKPDDAI